ncbi:MAG: type II toxin-antitoxin system VapC family toxin [Rubrivivax sp.]|jgi:predicted nucleic acid-binding protein
MFLLDTNVVSELRQGKPSRNGHVLAWASGQDVAMLYLSSVTVLELEIGVRTMERKDAVQGQRLRAWWSQVFEEFEQRILPFAEATALVCAPLHVPDKRPYRDSMIAATALEHGFTLVTRNITDFQIPGLKVVNPWDPIQIER